MTTKTKGDLNRLIPRSDLLASQGQYDPAYRESGAWRLMPYEVWRQEQQAKAGAGGAEFRAGIDFPERRGDGSVDGVSHAVTDHDEIVEMFTKLGRMVSGKGGDDGDPEKARLKKWVAEQGQLARRAAAGDGAALDEAVRRSIAQLRATDPVISGGVGSTPGDFAAQYPTPMNQTEIITLCDEITMYRALPEVQGDLNAETWRELTSLEFVSGTSKIAFPKGECPEEFQHDGENKTVNLKHIGVKKSLTESDILHSRGSIGRGVGINKLVGGFNDGGLPGEKSVASMVTENISDLKEKEMALASIATLNGWDQLLVFGDDGTYPLEFDGLINQITAANGARTNGGTSTGVFNVTHFNSWVAAGCARPDAVFGHPTALADLALSYLEVGHQVVNHNKNENVIPGVHFAGEIMTSYGPLALIGDNNFPVTDNGDGTITSTIYPVKMRHNGEPLIYKRTQIPLAFKDLVPGCTAIAFEIFAVTALVVKAMCAQGRYTARWNGLVQNGCTYIDPNH